MASKLYFGDCGFGEFFSLSLLPDGLESGELVDGEVVELCGDGA